MANVKHVEFLETIILNVLKPADNKEENKSDRVKAFQDRTFV